MQRHLMTHREQQDADCRARNATFITYALAIATAIVIFLLVEATR